MTRRTLLSMGFAPLALRADEAAFRRMEAGKQQVQAWMVAEARRLTDRARAEMASPPIWSKVRAQRLEEMRDMLGLLPWPERTPLNLKVAGTLDKPGYTIERISFESLPKFYVTANLYIPKNRAQPVPAVIYVCGHAIDPTGAKTQYQRHGISLAKNGYAAFMLDPIQISELFALHHGVQSQEMYDWYSRGYTPAGVEVWNAMRAIDYLETRPEVDKERIGMTGRSGGAAISWFTASVDPRIKAVAPVMGISTYAADLVDDTQKLHCDCMFPINVYRHDMLHQGALIAPRPLLMAHGRQDSLFPIPGYKEFETVTSALYAASGVADKFRNIEVDTGHKDSDFLREQVIRWFDRHLMNVPERKLDMDYSNAAPETLTVFGAQPPSDAVNATIHQTFNARPAAVHYGSVEQWSTRAKGLRQTLASRVFHLPPADFSPLKSPAPGLSEWQEQSFTPTPGISLRVLLRTPKQAGPKRPAVLWIASDGEDAGYLAKTLGGVQRRGDAVQMVVYPRGTGEIGWDRSFWKATMRNAMLIGQTIDSMRLADVLQAFRALSALPGVDAARITLAGRGISGILGLYAAILEPSVLQVLLLEPPSSHVEGPVFLGILKHTDIPEAASLLAPRRLLFYDRMPEPYAYTRDIFRLTGHPESPSTVYSIDAPVSGIYKHDFSSGY